MQHSLFKTEDFELGMVVLVFHPSTPETEAKAGGSQSFRPAKRNRVSKTRDRQTGRRETDLYKSLPVVLPPAEYEESFHCGESISTAEQPEAPVRAKHSTCGQLCH